MLQVEMTLEDRVDELMELLDLAQNQIHEKNYVDAFLTLHEMYKIYEIYEH